MSHPDLEAALTAPDAAALLRISLRARAAAHDGRFCECGDPDVVGYDLMCGHCLLNNQDQERRAVIRRVAAHPFEVDEDSHLKWCWCTQFEDHPRHNGVDGVGKCMWGEEIHPPYPTHLIRESLGEGS